MMHYTHSPGGVMAVCLYYSLMPPGDYLTLGLGLVAGGVGGLLPDIDHSGSKISKSAGFVGSILSKILKHRGVTHTPILWCVLMGLMNHFLPQWNYLSFPVFLGCLSHIFLDALTPKGVPLFAPLSGQKVRFLKIKTGGKLEMLCSVLLQIGCVVLIIRLCLGESSL